MIQLSTFKIQFDNNEIANDCFSIVEKYTNIENWKSNLKIQDKEITIGEDIVVSWEEYQGVFEKICKGLIEENKVDFNAYSEFCSDEREIHEYFLLLGSYYERVSRYEEYDADINEVSLYFGKIVNGKLTETKYELDDFDLEEEMCLECGDYVFKHRDYPFTLCYYCGSIEKQENVETEIVELPKWKEHEFEIPLGIELPDRPISVGQDWIDDCDEDVNFGLNPTYYHSKNQYLAALKLCQACDGWYRFETEQERMEKIECYRAIVSARPKEPMSYYNVWQNSFDWLQAFKENNKKYEGKLLDVNDLWTLFNRLGQRSCLDKAEAFDWFIDYFGDALKYEKHYKLSDQYVSNYYDQSMEMALYLKPEQIEVLTKSVAKVSTNSCPALARFAAGLIRLGKRDLGLSLYKKAFAMVWSDKSTLDDKKNVVDQFLERLAMGYENESYIDEEIAKLLDKQCQKYSDGSWTSKIRMNLGK